MTLGHAAGGKVKRLLEDSSKGARGGMEGAEWRRLAREFFYGNLEKKKKKKKTQNSLNLAKGQRLSGHTTPVPLPLTKLQARVSHLQDVNTKGKERGKRWHGTGTGRRAEVGGNGKGRRSHCLATVPGHVHW